MLTNYEETIFSKIIRKEIPAAIVYQDELVTAFRDIAPQAKTHILIIPNRLITLLRKMNKHLGVYLPLLRKLPKKKALRKTAIA